MAEKKPSFQFYPGDWRKDPDLSRCSKAAKGVWIDMLCLMFECEDRGVFSTGGVSWLKEEIAAAIGGDIAENLLCIDELLRKGVAHWNTSGAIFSRRIVRDEEIRQAKSKAGMQGGRPKSKTKAKRKQTQKQKGGSSSSSSTSVIPPTPLGGNGDLKNGSGSGLKLENITRTELGQKAQILAWAERNVHGLTEDIRQKILACSRRARRIGDDPSRLFLKLVRMGLTEGKWVLEGEDEHSQRGHFESKNL